MVMTNQSKNVEEEYYSSAKRFFHLLAPFYDTITAFDFRLRSVVEDFTHARKGSVILDVATGTGKQALLFARRGYEVIGVDLSQDMLSRAEKKNKDKRVSFGLADATTLPFKHDVFDVSSVSFALHDMPFPIRKRVVTEMVRVTKSEGTIVVVDYGLPRKGASRFLIYQVVRLYERYYPEFIRSDLADLLRQSGADIEDELSFFADAARIIKASKR